MRESCRRVPAIVAALALLTASAAFAQTSLATVRGKVTDEQGGMLPGATVTARQVETNTTRSSVSGSLGQYFLSSLPAGTYEITVELSGFSPARRSGVVLRVGEAADVDFVLGVGAVQESVTVAGQAALVETQHVLGTFIDPKRVDSLPTLNRNFADLALLAPGVTSTGTSSMGFSASGQHQYQNNVYVDGATNAMQFYGTQADSYPQDWIQEFRVMTNGYSAEFGNASGAVLNVITRSGANNVKGRAYGFFQNGKFNSPPYSGHYTNGVPVFLDTTPSYNQHRIGGFLGGPIVTDKLFYFGGFESLDNDATTSLSISEYWRNQGIASIIPTSNTRRPFLLKGDWNINKNNRLLLRYDRTIQQDTNCSGQGGDGCNSSPNWTLEKRATFDGPLWSALGNWTTTLSNHAFNEARVYYGVNKLIITSNLAGKYGDALINDIANRGLYSEKNYPGAAFGSSVTGGLEGETNLYFTDNLTFLKGKHQFKMGGQLAYVTMYMDIDGSQKARWGFTSDRVFNINDPASYPTTLSLAIGTAKDTEGHWNGGIFAQDSWQLRDDLTLNLGIRYDVDNSILTGNQFVDSYNQRFVSAFGGAAPLTKVTRDLNNVAPRLGFVWVPTESRRTTIRGSGGIFYDQSHFNYNDVYINQTLLAVRRYSFNANDSTTNPFFNPADPAGSALALRAFLAKNFPDWPDFSQLGPGGQFVNGMDPGFRIPYTIQFTGGFTHEFTGRLFVQADYVGSRGKDAVISRNVNVQQVDGRFVIIDPRFSSFSLFQNRGFIDYNALQTRAEHRGVKLQAGVSYTLAKTFSNTLATGVGGGAATNPLDLSIDEGPANEDRRHNLVLDGSYLFPLDFQLAGIYKYASPLPYSVTSATVVFARPEPRGSHRGDNYRTMNLRISKIFKFGSRLSATGFWEVFNLFNTDNFTSFQGSLQSSQFGQPQAEFPKRQQQFGFKVDF
ncbi:MAG TPA: carboxypeptidase regulatory-like domain-containing protein [Vicinamibacterales bacterium]|nr:carboxypeptidase regulatory-like domain-containing protein [Vicinamibacterales bacterium]